MSSRKPRKKAPRVELISEGNDVQRLEIVFSNGTKVEANRVDGKSISWDIWFDLPCMKMAGDRDPSDVALRLVKFVRGVLVKQLSDLEKIENQIGSVTIQEVMGS